MCRNGLYTEHGIKGRNGFGAERFRIDPAFAVKVDPALGILGVLLEPTSVVAKAWDHCDRVWRLKSAPSRKLLVTGAGPIGLLGALLGMQRGYEVHVYDHNTTGPKPELTRALGATYHSGELSELAALAPDIVMECTGVPDVITALLSRWRPAASSASPASACRRGASSTSANSIARWYSTTARCSAPSTPIASIMRRRPTRSRAPTAAGLRA